MHCIDLTSKRIKTLRYVAKLQKWSHYNELHRFDVKTIKTFELGRKTTKVIKLLWIASIWHQNNLKCGDTSQNYKSDQIIMNCIDLTSKRSKLLSYVAKLQNDQIIVHCIDLTSKRIKTLRYVAKLQKWSNYNELHRFDVKTIKTFELGRKTTKVIKLLWIASIWRQNDQNFWVTSQNYKMIKL